MRPRLIATDLDGTLLGADHSLSTRTVDAVKAAVAQGIEFVLVTARPPRTVTRLAEQLGGRIEALCCNGAILAEFETGTTTLIKSFDAQEAADIVRRLRPALPEAGFALETGFEVFFEQAFRIGSVGDDRRIPVEDAAALDACNVGADGHSARSIVKVLARSARRTADEMVAVAADTLRLPGEHRPGCEISHSGGRGLLEIAPASTSKASALEWLCARRGIDAREVAAFGDMPNDLGMLRWAGTGHAVANAHPAVMAAADEIVGHHTEDGVAETIERMLD